jgi:hypothetical protein
MTDSPRGRRTDEDVAARALEHKARFETVVKRQEARLGEAIRPMRLTPEDAAGPVPSGSGTLDMVKKKRAEAKSKVAEGKMEQGAGVEERKKGESASATVASPPAANESSSKTHEPATQSTSLAKPITTPTPNTNTPAPTQTPVVSPRSISVAKPSSTAAPTPEQTPRTLQISHITPEPEASLKDVDLGDAYSEESFEAIAVPTRTYETEHNGATRKWYKGFRRG